MTPQPASKPQKQRLDLLLVERGLAETREQARRRIMAGDVRVDGQPCDKPGKTVPAAADVQVRAPLPYVSRGGVKLAAALDAFRLDVSGLVAADIGASTGGFTDCLLQRGAARASPSTSATANSPGSCATTRASTSSSAPTSA